MTELFKPDFMNTINANLALDNFPVDIKGITYSLTVMYIRPHILSGQKKGSWQIVVVTRDPDNKLVVLTKESDVSTGLVMDISKKGQYPFVLF